MKHTFKSTSHDLEGLFKGVTRFSTFCNRLENQSRIDPIAYDSDKYKGDGFEFFVELFLSLHPNDNRIGLYNYEPILVNDNGVDGIGNNIIGEKSVAQVKYRSNTQSVLTANQDHLANLFSDGMMGHGVVADMDNKNNFRHFIFTTAKDLHFYTEQEMFKSKVKTFGYEDFRRFLDGNIQFWNSANKLINSLNIVKIS